MKSTHQWPALNYSDFKSTAHLLHMGVQVIGKLKLMTPFEPHWANVALWLTSRGLTTGLIPYQAFAFSIDIDFIEHKVIIATTLGDTDCFKITSMSVAQFTQQVFSLLNKMNIKLAINMMPQEIANPIAFDKDSEERFYNKALAQDWWQILINSYLVMQKYHARFDGETPPIGLMWGTFDLRDARYNGTPVATTGDNAAYIRRNAMNEAQVEVGFWPGTEAYPQAAYFSFTYPQPNNIENAKIKPAAARWDKKLMEFILDYDALRASVQPEKDLLDFFESTYSAGSQLAAWNPKLITRGQPS